MRIKLNMDISNRFSRMIHTIADVFMGCDKNIFK